MNNRELEKELQALLEKDERAFLNLVTTIFASQKVEETKQLDLFHSEREKETNYRAYVRYYSRHLSDFLLIARKTNSISNFGKVMFDFFSKMQHVIYQESLKEGDFNITKIEFQLGDSIQTIEYENNILNKFKENTLRKEATETREEYLNKLLDSSFSQYDDVYKELS